MWCIFRYNKVYLGKIWAKSIFQSWPRNISYVRLGRVNPKLRLTEQRLHTGHFTINLWQTIYHQIANELEILKNIFLDTKTVLLLATRQSCCFAIDWAWEKISLEWFNQLRWNFQDICILPFSWGWTEDFWKFWKLSWLRGFKYTIQICLTCLCNNSC
jgi:hypothetical protein